MIVPEALEAKLTTTGWQHRKEITVKHSTVDFLKISNKGKFLKMAREKWQQLRKKEFIIYFLAEIVWILMHFVYLSINVYPPNFLVNDVIKYWIIFCKKLFFYFFSFVLVTLTRDLSVKDKFWFMALDSPVLGQAVPLLWPRIAPGDSDEECVAEQTSHCVKTQNAEKEERYGQLLLL